MIEVYEQMRDKHKVASLAYEALACRLEELKRKLDAASRIPVKAAIIS